MLLAPFTILLLMFSRRFHFTDLAESNSTKDKENVKDAAVFCLSLIVYSILLTCPIHVYFTDYRTDVVLRKHDGR